VYLIDKLKGQVPKLLILGRLIKAEKIADCKGIRPQVTAWLVVFRRKSGQTGEFRHQYRNG
jgi:hypothetical protein